MRRVNALLFNRKAIVIENCPNNMLYVDCSEKFEKLEHNISLLPNTHQWIRPESVRHHHSFSICIIFIIIHVWCLS